MIVPVHDVTMCCLRFFHSYILRVNLIYQKNATTTCIKENIYNSARQLNAPQQNVHTEAAIN